MEAPKWEDLITKEREPAYPSDPVLLKNKKIKCEPTKIH